MALLEELRETAKAVGVDVGNKTMDQIELLREIAKALGVELDNQHMGVVELLSEINKVLPNSSIGGVGILPLNQTNKYCYLWQQIVSNTVIEIDCAKLADAIEAEGYDSLFNEWKSGSSANSIAILQLIGLDLDSSGYSYYDLALRNSSNQLSTLNMFTSPNEIVIGNSENSSNPLELLRNSGTITINCESISSKTILMIVGVLTGDSDILFNDTSNVDYVKVYNV